MHFRTPRRFADNVACVSSRQQGIYRDHLAVGIFRQLILEIQCPALDVK